jgi:hypothetical protein
MGARSNETSGRAIMAREREGDVSTFHFMDNMARAIRHTGRILIDLIPKVYTGARAVRIIGEDGEQQKVTLNQREPVKDPKTGQVKTNPTTGEVFTRLHDLAAGKYDLTVKTGPSFTTRREEAAFQMTEMIRAFPPSAPIIGPELAKNLDWPGADKIAEKLEAVTSGQLPPEVMKKIEEGKAQLQKLTQENQQLKMDQSAEKAQFQMEAQSSATKLKMEMQANQAKLNMERQKVEAELRAHEEIERLKIESAERLAIIKIQADTKIKAMTAHAQAQNQAEANKMKVQANGKSG